MKKSVVTALVISSFLFMGCTPNNSEPNPTTPVPSPSQTTIKPGPIKTPPVETAKPTKEPEAEPTKEPSVAPSSSEAVPPAVQFAKRWGAKYPDVPEYAILKAANGVCAVIEKSGADWADSDLALLAIKESAKIAGIDGNDAFEFAQDANQNYCASVANPA